MQDTLHHYLLTSHIVIFVYNESNILNKLRKEKKSTKKI